VVDSAWVGCTSRAPARYLVEKGTNGELRLIPIVSVPVRTFPTWTTEQEFEASFDMALDQVANGQTVSLGDFSQYLDDEDHK